MEEEKNNIKESRSSIELKRTSKGAYSWSIKFYLEDVDERQIILNKIEEVDNTLKKRYINEETEEKEEEK